MRQTSVLADLALIPENTVAIFDAEARRLVSDLHAPRPAVYWIDFLGSALVGWAGLIVAVRAAPFSPWMIAAAVVAVFALYRALCFMHEITHLRSGALAGFEPIWNVLVGLPLLMPSTVYVGVHQDHHKLSTYGTPEDPEYLPFARSHWMTIRFALASPLIPLFLALRFVVLVPLELAWPRFHRILVTHATSLSLNPQYRRVVSPEVSRRIRLLHLAAFAMWTSAAWCAWTGLLPWRAFLIWYVVTAVASVINTLRTLVAHDYEGSGAAMSRREQLLDSIDTPGAVWTELWAPVGLRYHALHHYFPGIPYHNLAEGYRRLLRALPDYTMSSGDGLVPELANLYRKGRAAETSGR